jgi:hypothetical protein
MTSKTQHSWRQYFYGERSGIIMSRTQAMTHLVHSIREQALTRRQYKNRIEGHLTGPFADFIRIKLGLFNGKRKWARRWRQEVEEKIEFELPGWLLHPTKGFSDPRKAALEALERLKGDEQHNRRVAARFLQRDFGLRKIRPLPPDASAEFFAWAEAVVDQVFLLEETRLSARQSK